MHWSFMLCSDQVCIGHSCYVLTRYALVIHVMFSPGRHWSFMLCSHQICIGHSCYVLTRYALVIHVMFSPGMHWSFMLCSHQVCIGHSHYVLTRCALVIHVMFSPVAGMPKILKLPLLWNPFHSVRLQYPFIYLKGSPRCPRIRGVY